MTYPTVTKAPSATLAEAAIANSADSKFELLYFPLLARSMATRIMLKAAGANAEYPVADWPAMKEKTRFGVLPALFEKTSNGTVLELAESSAIERYLSKKFNFLGSNAWEEHLINESVSNTDGIQEALIKAVFAEDRSKAFETFYTTTLPKWFTFAERRMVENGSNGHVVGDKLTWADIKILVFLDSLRMFVPTGLELPAIPEAMNKVGETTKAVPKIAEWIASEDYATLKANTLGFLKF
ncbi:hypothetical protein BGZ94_009511 [Podila epigama]|nr:hypothetical protein BGZ94_009511 [Podila epigama]